MRCALLLLALVAWCAGRVRVVNFLFESTFARGTETPPRPPGPRVSFLSLLDDACGGTGELRLDATPSETGGAALAYRATVSSNATGVVQLAGLLPGSSAIAPLVRGVASGEWLVSQADWQRLLDRLVTSSATSACPFPLSGFFTQCPPPASSTCCN
jgi:hypothetical protein